MSSDEEYNDYDASGRVTRQILSKKRKVQRACDICRRKKIRCDGGQMPGNRCTNCITYEYQCTYVEGAKKRGPPKGYVENLENRLEKIQTLLHRLMPDADFTKDPEIAESERNKKTILDLAASMIRQAGTSQQFDDVPSDDEAISLPDSIHESFSRLSVSTHRFFGKSSSALLLHHVMSMREELTGVRVEKEILKNSLLTRRPQFWEPNKWEQSVIASTPKHNYTFPDDDLIDNLVHLYFEHINLLTPLLHRPTFEKQIKNKLHLADDSFGAVVLLVCAVASRYSEDPRVFLEEADSTHSCGWKWFDQVQLVRKSLLSPPTLYDLQVYCLSVQFLTGTSAPQACWIMVGIGIRLAQDVGAHRRNTYHGPPTIEQELRKRAWWILVCMDRSASSSLGRPCATQDEDFDVGLPTECDDEYWDHPDPEKAWKQPPGKPSTATFFNSLLKLNQILAIALRTIYGINKNKVCIPVQGWEQQIVTELDSALNQWVDSIPDHLRWNPNQGDTIWLRQSVVLYANYYHLQILIHRPFIPSPSKPSPLSFPSLAICTNAARSCSHIVDQYNMNCPYVMINIQMPVFTSAIVLLLNIWGGKRAGLTTDPSREMKDVYKCMDMLRLSEKRWQSAGRLWDILYELASIGDLPLPSPLPSTNKRGRDEDQPNSSCSEGQSPSSDGNPRTIATNRRVKSCGHIQRKYRQQQGEQGRQASDSQSQQAPAGPSQSSSMANNAFDLPLPMYSDDLARLPLHGQFNFTVPPPVCSGVHNNNPQEPLDMIADFWHTPSHAPTDPLAFLALNGEFYGMPPSSGGGDNQSGSSPSTGSVATPTFVDTPSGSGSGSAPRASPALHQQNGMRVPQSAGAASSTVFGDGLSVMPSASTMTVPAGSSPSKRPNAGAYDRFNEQNQLQQQQMMLDQDAMAMWSSTPTGFELDDWGAYLSSVTELQQQHQGGNVSSNGSGF